MVSILTITSVMAISQTNFFDNYLPVVSGNVYQVFNEQMSGSLLYSSDSNRLLASVLPVEGEENFFPTADTGKYTVNVGLEGPSAGLFSYPGSKNVQLANLVVKSIDSSVELKSVVFDVTEIGNVRVERVYLFDGENKVAEAKVVDGYARFSGLSVQSPDGDGIFLNIRIDLSDKSSSGSRVKLGVSEAKYLNVFANGSPHDFRRFSPINGPYLSVVNIQGK
jgi:hypothetical protein